MFREKTVMIWKSNESKDLWGYVVDPKDVGYFVETNMLAIQTDLTITKLQALKRERGFKSLNSFLMAAIHDNAVQLVEPMHVNSSSGTFLYDGKPKFFWSIDEERLFPAKGFRPEACYIYTANGVKRIVRASDCIKDFCTYDPFSKNVDGDITWYDAKIHNKKLVLKDFNGATLANIMREADFQKLISGKS